MPTTRPTSGPERQTHANFGNLLVGSGALSVHAYSPPLTSMGFYDETGQIRLDRRPVDGRMPAAEQPRAMHPAGRHGNRSATHTRPAGSAGSPLQLSG